MNELIQENSKKKSPPIFIVGSPRSGTTMLAVLLGRHSKIAIPPETQFFSVFVPQMKNKYFGNHKEMVEEALKFTRINDLNLQYDDVLKEFQNYEKSFPSLLRSILTIYTRSQKKERSGEKSPLHLESVPEILNYYPEAKIICIVRDGRDVVRSLLKVPWAEPDNPRRLYLFCADWVRHARLALKYDDQISKDSFLLVKYEDIIISPEFELKKIFNFIGEDIELSQLNPSLNTSIVPQWENKWKGKANKMLDPTRVGAWRRSSGKKEICKMNGMMMIMLKRLNYQDASFNRCSLFEKFKMIILRIIYSEYMRSFALFILRIYRYVKKILLPNGK